MLHLRELGHLNEDVLTATGETLGSNLDWWAASERRARVRQTLEDKDNIHPSEVILSPDAARGSRIDEYSDVPTWQPRT